MDADSRRAGLAQARLALSRIPVNQFFELPGRPTVVFQARDYAEDKAQGRALARGDVPFLFRAFEAGQAPPPRPGTRKAEEPRAATIHEYLDWTVTSSSALEEDQLVDFGGFRVVALLPRFRPAWPPPGAYEAPVPRKCTLVGAPKDPLPQLLTGGKPICAATIRVGLGYLEVPFFATADTKRNRGYGRALLEAIEDIARCLSLPLLLLCSTDDEITRATWLRLGFVFTQPADLLQFGVGPRDLLHMDNTVQMHKSVPPARIWKSVILKHQHWRQRVYTQAAPNNGEASSAAGDAAGRPSDCLQKYVYQRPS